MVIFNVLLGALLVLCLCLHFLTRRFKSDCIDGDPACPIREQRRIWNHIGWFSKSSDEKIYVKQHAPWLFLLNRIAMLLMFVTAPWLIFLLLAGKSA